MNRSWVRFPQAAQKRPPGNGWAFLYALTGRAAWCPTGVPGVGGPGCGAGLLCAPVGGGPPASRPRREPSARRVVSKPGQAPPPPTGAAARPINPSGALHTGGAVSLMCACTSPRSPARPSGPSGALHISAARCADGWLGASSRRLARLRRRPRAPQPGPPIPSAPRLEARPGPPDPPAPSTSVVPGVLMGGSVRRLEDWPGSAAARAIVISHAIPLRHCADSYRSATLRHSCF